MNDDESKRLLKQIFEINKENNKLLKKMRRAAIAGNILRLIWWVIIFGVPIYFYFAVFQPFLGEVGGTFEGFRTGLSDIFRLILNPGEVIDVGSGGGNVVE